MNEPPNNTAYKMLKAVKYESYAVIILFSKTTFWRRVSEVFLGVIKFSCI